MYEEIYAQAKQACNELCDVAKLKEGSIVVIGCSSSEVAGGTIGHNSSLETAQAVFKGIYEVLCERKIYLAAQCCEHLNRAIIVEREAVPNAEIHSQRQAVRLPQQHTKHSKIPLRLKKSRLTQVLTSAEHLSVCTLEELPSP